MNLATAEAHLKSFADRIDRLDEELKAINGDKKEVYLEAKAQGFDVNILKAAIKRRRRLTDAPGATAEADTLLEIYVRAITSLPEAKTAPTGSAGPANGNPKEPRAHVHAHEEPLPPHDPETGEVEEDIPADLDRRERAAA